jgi:hypothetical protein
VKPGSTLGTTNQKRKMTISTAKKILKNGQRVIAHGYEVYLAQDGVPVYIYGGRERVATPEMLAIACEVSHFEEIGLLINP